MNDIITAISATITRMSCDKCDPHELARRCQEREEQCHAHFRTEAEAIYTAHIKPLEEVLAKAEADKAVLVEALQGIFDDAQSLDDCSLLALGDLLREETIRKARATLARVKESPCPKN